MEEWNIFQSFVFFAFHEHNKKLFKFGKSAAYL